MKSTILFVGVLIITLTYLVLKIIEVIRYMNYGHLSEDVQLELKECKWMKSYFVQDGIKKYTCVRPSIIKIDRTHCTPQCKHRKFCEMPNYEKMTVLEYLEQIIAVIASVYAVVTAFLELYSKFVI